MSFDSRNAWHRDASELTLPGVIGCSSALREVIRITHQVSPSCACVLIVGETGTGKELIARAIHDLSPRSTGPYIRVNCGALTESLLESELFGHVKGSFTGAVDNRTGRFEAATPAASSSMRSTVLHRSFRSSFFASYKKENSNGLVTTILRRLTPESSPLLIVISSTKSKRIAFAKISITV